MIVSWRPLARGWAPPPHSLVWAVVPPRCACGTVLDPFAAPRLQIGEMFRAHVWRAARFLVRA